jgi:hypothetical protein
MKKQCQSCPFLSNEQLTVINKKLDGIVKLLEYQAVHFKNTEGKEQ